MPSPRLVFLDIDGTYAFHGAVPPEHVDAVRAARSNGHRVLLCTGRPRATVSDRLLAAGFDGVVAGAGAYAELDGEVLRDETFPADVAAKSIAALDRHHAVSLVEATEAMYVRTEGREAMDSRAPGSGSSQEEVWRDLLAGRRVVETFDGLAFCKVVTLSADVPLSEIAAEIGPEVAAVDTSIRDLGRGAGELYLAHITKEVGMRAVVDRLGLTAADVVAAGDGPNDIEMIRYAGTAIGIEGGHSDVLANADVVVPGPDHAGLVQGFERVGLI
ncbi:HAD hydrolase family protein [Demequina sp. NBRC 110056]|uniref:HAD hydrolase family protein n=1 Tax=Demequina sp. NBRC 110056 TaxID=1570345 RepID=UPI000A065C04|nr:HAD hydrolase family protein [Demequina sp. NBRC 110056]